MELIAALKMRQIGDEIEVLSTDKGSVTDIPEWCKKVKHECISVDEKTGYWSVLKAAMLSGRVLGAMAHDARIFAVCRQHGVKTLWSADRDMTRFAGIRVVNPLVAAPAQ